MERFRRHNKNRSEANAEVVAPFQLLKSGLEEVTQRANKFKDTKDKANVGFVVKESEEGILYLQKDSTKIEMVVWTTGEPDEVSGTPSIYLVGHSSVYSPTKSLRCTILPLASLSQKEFSERVYRFLTEVNKFDSNISDTNRPELFRAARDFLLSPKYIK